MRLRNILIYIVATVAMASCAKGDVEDAASGVALNLCAVIDNSTLTRATADNSSFSVNDAIGIFGTYSDMDGQSVTSGYKRYTYSATGWESESPFYYQNSKAVTFYGYYPYDSKGYTDGKGGLATVSAKDYLYASATGSVASNDVQLKFNHLMAKIKVTFTISDDTPANVTEFYVGGLYTKGTFDTLNGKVEGTDGSDNLKGTMTGDKEGYVVVFPQTVTTGATITVKVGGINYKAQLCSNSKELEQNCVYKCSVEINKTGVSATFSVSDIEGWSEDGGTVTAVADNLYEGMKNYALFYTDGTYANVVDGEAISEALIKAAVDAQTDTRKICGVVFYVGDPSADDELMRSEHPLCVHGLMVSLKILGNKMHWQDTPGYCGTNVSTDKMMGYSNTAVLRIYNSGLGSDDATRVLPLDALDNSGSLDSYSQSSGWYLPSVKELTMLLGNDVRDNVATVLGKIGVDALTGGETKYYWSSTEASANTDAYRVLKKDGSSATGAKNNGNYHHVRAICAF